MKGSGRIAIKLYDRLCAIAKETRISVIHGHIHHRAGSIQHFREGFTKLQTPSGRIFHVRSGDHTIDGGAKLGALYLLFGALDGGFPIVGLHSLDSRFTTIIGGERAIHLQ